MSSFVTVGCFLLFFAVVGTVWWFSADQVAMRALAAQPVTPIRELRPGEAVKVSGRVVLDRRQIAPLSHRACAWCRVTVEVPQGSGAWKRAGELVREGPFWVEDDSGGRVRIELAEGDHLLVTAEVLSKSGTFDDPDVRELAVLRELGLPESGLLGLNRAYRYSESRLDAGERVSVAGTVVLREVGGEVVLALHAPEGRLVISDAPHL